MKLLLLLTVLFGLLCILFDGGVHAASNQHLAVGKAPAHPPMIDPGAPPTGEWFPLIPARVSSPEDYCKLWAEKVVYGIGAFIKASPDERTKSLIITYQTGQWDHDHPEFFKSVDTDDGSHATVILVTDGYDQQGHWILKKPVMQWAEKVIVYGWGWAKASKTTVSHEDLPTWMQRMMMICLRDEKL